MYLVNPRRDFATFKSVASRVILFNQSEIRSRSHVSYGRHDRATNKYHSKIVILNNIFLWGPIIKFYATFMKMQLDVSQKRNAIKSQKTTMMSSVMLLPYVPLSARKTKYNVLVESIPLVVLGSLSAYQKEQTEMEICAT